MSGGLKKPLPIGAWRMPRLRAASGAVGLLTAIVWFTFAPARPALEPAHRAPALGDQVRAALAVLRDRNLVILSLGYAMEAAVFFVFIFWFFRYLTEGRGMTVLASGVWGSIPYFAAAVIAPIGGWAADALGIRFTLARGRRIVQSGLAFVRQRV